MSVFTPLPGMPGLVSESLASHRTLGGNGSWLFAPGGGVIDTTKTRDPFNSTDVTRLEAGLLMGRVTSGGKYAPAVVGTLASAYSTGTSMVTSAASGDEIIRRFGATGTFKLTGPPIAGGTVRTQTVTYSAESAGTVTVTSLPAAAVWTLVHAAGTDGGFYKLKVTLPDGTSDTTVALAWNADTATVDAALGDLSVIDAGDVAAVFAVDTLTLTFLATLGDVRVDVVSDTTSDGGVFEGGWVVTHTTAGVDGRFVAGSLIQPTDGSETILTFLEPGWDIPLPADVTSDVPLPRIVVGGSLDTTRLLPAVSDASLKAYVRAALNLNGRFSFTDAYAA